MSSDFSDSLPRFKVIVQVAAAAKTFRVVGPLARVLTLGGFGQLVALVVALVAHSSRVNYTQSPAIRAYFVEHWRHDFAQLGGRLALGAAGQPNHFVRRTFKIWLRLNFKFIANKVRGTYRSLFVSKRLSIRQYLLIEATSAWQDRLGHLRACSLIVWTPIRACAIVSEAISCGRGQYLSPVVVE